VLARILIESYSNTGEKNRQSTMHYRLRGVLYVPRELVLTSFPIRVFDPRRDLENRRKRKGGNELAKNHFECTCASGLTFCLVLLITSSNSCLFLPLYSCSSSRSSTRCFGLGAVVSWKSAASRNNCSAVICTLVSLSVAALGRRTSRRRGWENDQDGDGMTDLDCGGRPVLDSSRSFTA